MSILIRDWKDRPPIPPNAEDGVGQIPLDHFAKPAGLARGNRIGGGRRTSETDRPIRRVRICLPKASANATVIIDQVSDTEVRDPQSRDHSGGQECPLSTERQRIRSPTGTFDRFLELLITLRQQCRPEGAIKKHASLVADWQIERLERGQLRTRFLAASRRVMNLSNAWSVSTRSVTWGGLTWRSIPVTSRCSDIIHWLPVRSPFEPPRIIRPKMSRHPVPVILLARLAVGQSEQLGRDWEREHPGCRAPAAASAWPKGRMARRSRWTLSRQAKRLAINRTASSGETSHNQFRLFLPCATNPIHNLSG